MLWTTLLSSTGATSMACVEQLPIAAWQSWWCMQAATVQLPAAAASGFVLSTAELSVLGVSRAQARTRVRRGEWTVPRPGYVAPLIWTHRPVRTGGSLRVAGTLWRRRRRRTPVTRKWLPA